MNKQEVFNKVKSHLLTQNIQAAVFNEDGSIESCKYRDMDKNRTCAIGCLIPDSDYNPLIEGVAVSEILYLNEVTFSGRESIITLKNILEKNIQSETEEDYIFLADLQDTHDNFDPQDWPQQLKQIANNYGLKYE